MSIKLHVLKKEVDPKIAGQVNFRCTSIITNSAKTSQKLFMTDASQPICFSSQNPEVIKGISEGQSFRLALIPVDVPIEDSSASS